MKFSGQNVFDAVNLGRYVSRRQAGDFADRCGIHALEIGEDDLAIHRLQPLDQPKKPAERLLMVGVRHRRVGHMVEFFQTDQDL